MVTETFTPNRAGYVARRILEDLRRRGLTAGQRLPSVRELAEQHATSIATAQSAVRLLHKRGFVECRPRQGAFVAYRPSGQIGLVSVPLTRDVGRPAHAYDESTDHWRFQINKAAIDRFHLDGYQTVMLCITREELEETGGDVPMLDEARDQLDAIIIPADQRLVDQVERRGLTWATINACHPADLHNFVSADNTGGFDRVGQCLAACGRHRVFILATALGLSGRTSSAERVQGVYLGFLRAGAPTDGIEVIQTGRYGMYEEDAFQAVSNRLRQGEPPQAIIAVGDLLAFGAMRAVQAHGLRVPEDVAIVGGTGLELAAYTSPTLTVVAQPTQRIGWELAGMVLKMLRDGQRRAVCRRIPAPLIFRESFAVNDDLRHRMEQAYEQDVARFEMNVDDDVAAVSRASQDA